MDATTSASRPPSARTSIMLKLACTTDASNSLKASVASTGLLAETPQARIFPAFFSPLRASRSPGARKAS